MKKIVTVCGAGSWGTALAIVLADNGYQVSLWTHRKEQADEINKNHTNEKYLQVQLPKNIIAFNDIGEAVKNTEAIIIVVPTKAIREVMKKLNPYIHNDLPLIHATKGIEPNSLKRVSEMIAEELTNYDYENITVLSGPSHAEEVAKRQPTSVTVSAINKQRAKIAQNLFFNAAFRVYTSSDIVGIELGGALKNIIALGAGISDGLGFGDNAKAALITRGLAEITRLGTTLGANPLTFLGLPGVGDLIVTCTSVHSRNWRAGHLLGKGESLDEILEKMGMVVEGIRTTEAAYQFAKKQKIEMPITEAIYNIIFHNQSTDQAVEQLMTRDRRSELDDFSILLHNR